MLGDKRIGVVVPAYDEGKFIGKVILTMPEFVDKIIVVDDGSKDRTKAVVQELMSSRRDIVLIDHAENRGLGRSLIDGYLKSLELDMDVTAVMAGDAQMDPGDLRNVLAPVVEEKADYVKGNRLLTENVSRIMPWYRFVGNSFLTLLTKFATGYWHVIDPQCGYTAISKRALGSIEIAKMTKGYGYNADILNMLNLANCTVKDVQVKPVYGNSKSKIRLASYIPRVSCMLVRLYWKRMFCKYLVREFHPLVFFYLFSFFEIVVVSVPLTCRFVYLYSKVGLAPRTTLIILAFSMMMGFFSFFFGMWLDMESNKGLKG